LLACKCEADLKRWLLQLLPSRWRASITLPVAEFGEFCFCIDVCVECFRALFLSSLASLKDKDWENIGGRRDGGEGREEIKMG
jgi:hypothetical protein